MRNEETQPIREFFTRRETLFVLIVIILGLLLRWLQLDTRPIHHDESLHAIYGKYFYTDPNEKFYRYDPLLHGPVLYNTLPYFYQFLDVTKWAGRSMIACLGSFFILIPLLFRRYLTRNTILTLISFIALSPSLIFWSRFLREDLLVLFSMFLMIWGVTVPNVKWKSGFFFTGLALHFCVKENSYVTLALLLGFLFFEQIFSMFFRDAEQETLLKKFFKVIKNNPRSTCAGFLFASFIFCYFYSSGFRYSEGILDGLYRKGFIYWLTQHNMDRIKGPFVFHFLNLAWYEFLFILAFFSATIHFYLKSSWIVRTPIIAGLFLSGLLHYTFRHNNLELIPLFNFLKLKISVDFYLFFFLIIHSLVLTIKHLLQRERLLAFWGYFFIASFFAYSFVGEKVPWLSLYPFTAGIIYLAFYFQHKNLLDYFFSLPIKGTSLQLKPFFFAFLILFNLRMSLMTNFARAGDETEFISQVHTTKTFEQTMLGIQKEMLTPQKGFSPKVLILNDAIWPCTWYFFGLEGFNFIAPIDNNYQYYDYVIANVDNVEVENALSQTHYRLALPLRAWWVPEYDKMNLAKFLLYSLTHNPWNPPGRYDVAYYVKKQQSPH